MRIGFIGAGVMGAPMAASLMAAGHALSVVAHRNRAPVEALVAAGAREAESIPALAEASEAIFLCLGSSRVVESVIATAVPALRAGQLVIDTSTSEPSSTRRIAGDLAVRGVAFADAPVTGGPEQAQARALGSLVGADAPTFARARPLLAAYSSRVEHMGPVGTGHIAKLVNNYLVCGMIGLIAEGFIAARRAGIDWRKLYAAALCGSADSGALRKMMAHALDGDFAGYRFTVANAHKDAGYYCELARGLAMRSPLAEATCGFFAAAAAAGHGARLVSELVRPELDASEGAARRGDGGPAA